MPQGRSSGSIPFREYHRAMETKPTDIDSAYFEGWLVTGAVNDGLPLNTLVSTDDAPGALASGALDGRVVLTPASALSARSGTLIESMLNRGIDVVVYGAVPAVPTVERLLNLHRSEPGLGAI